MTLGGDSDVLSLAELENHVLQVETYLQGGKSFAPALVPGESFVIATIYRKFLG